MVWLCTAMTLLFCWVDRRHLCDRHHDYISRASDVILSQIGGGSNSAYVCTRVCAGCVDVPAPCVHDARCVHLPSLDDVELITSHISGLTVRARMLVSVPLQHRYQKVASPAGSDFVFDASTSLFVAYARMRTHACIRIHTHMYTYTSRYDGDDRQLLYDALAPLRAKFPRVRNHACMRAHAHKCTHTLTHALMHAHTYARTYARTHIPPRTHVCACGCMRARVHTCTCACTHAYLHRRTCAHADTHALTHACTCTSSVALSHLQTHARTHARRVAHMLAHMHAHTHARTHTCTHACMHTQVVFLNESLPYPASDLWRLGRHPMLSAVQLRLCSSYIACMRSRCTHARARLHTHIHTRTSSMGFHLSCILYCEDQDSKWLSNRCLLHATA